MQTETHEWQPTSDGHPVVVVGPPDSLLSDDRYDDPPLCARTDGDEAAAVVVGRHCAAETTGYCSPAIAVDAATVAHSCVTASTRDYASAAVAVGLLSSDVHVLAESAGDSAPAVAIGGVADAFASGNWAYAFAPTGTAHSERYIGIGLRVVLETADSVGVILPPPRSNLRPVVVDGRSYPTGVELALNSDGQVHEV